MHLPDPKKGEQIILVTTHSNAQRETLISYAQQHRISVLSIPKTILIIDEIPLLATGKIDYVTLREWVESRYQS